MEWRTRRRHQLRPVRSPASRYFWAIAGRPPRRRARSPEPSADKIASRRRRADFAGNLTSGPQRRAGWPDTTPPWASSLASWAALRAWDSYIKSSDRQRSVVPLPTRLRPITIPSEAAEVGRVNRRRAWSQGLVLCVPHYSTLWKIEMARCPAHVALCSLALLLLLPGECSALFPLVRIEQCHAVP